MRIIIAYYKRKQLLKKFIFIDNADTKEVLEKFETSTSKDIINELIFHDEQEPAIRDLENNFLAYFFLGRLISRIKKKNLTDISYGSNKYFINNGVISIKCSGIYNWLFFIYKTTASVYKVELDIIFHSNFYEFQWALKIKSVYERFRFRLTNEEKISFEIITRGCFQDDLFSKQFIFNIDKTYHAEIIVDNNEYYLIIDKGCVMKVVDCSNMIDTGDLALLFYDNENHFICAEISNIIYKEVNN